MAKLEIVRNGPRMKLPPPRLSLAVILAVQILLPRLSEASRVTGGEMMIDFDAAALAALNYGSDPNVAALILEEFFGGTEDSSRTRAQLVADHLVPGFVEIPATGLRFEINGPSVVNLTGRFSQPTNMTFRPEDLAGTVAGSIGLRGVLRFMGDFDGMFGMGDFVFRYDASRIHAASGRTAWVFVNYFDNFRATAFETKDVTADVKPGRLTMSGTLVIAEQFANAFLSGDSGKPVGTFHISAAIPGSEFIPMEMVEVKNAGNLPDPATGYGSVGYDYWIGTTEVTNAQWARFLNIVDPAGVNPHNLYNSNMSSDLPVSRGGIDFSAAAPAGAKYQPKPKHGNKPVSYVSFYDAARFANWMGTGDTERGFYSFSGEVTFSAEGTHGPAFGGPYVAIASEDEWYKAAYHKNDGATGNYWHYPTRSDVQPAIAASTAEGDIANPGTNVANYDFGADWNDSAGLGNVTTVGSAGPSSAGPYGTYDQGGNSWEWCSTLTSGSRVMRGGSLWSPGAYMQSTHRSDYFPETGGSSLAFRISSNNRVLPSAAGSALDLADVHVQADNGGVPAIFFHSRSDCDYRFDYSVDGLEWHRLHTPVTGTGALVEIPVPQAFRASGRCFVRAVVWIR